jgi:hypothetical protein
MDKENSTDQKIKRFQALLPYLDVEYRGLLAVFETLKLTTTEELQREFVRTPRAQGFNVVADALLARCVIIMHRLLDASRKTNPSLCYLARPLLKKNEAEFAKVMRRLATLHPQWPELVLQWRGMQSYFYIPKPAEQRTASTAQKQDQKFRERIERIRSEWAFFEAERESKLDDPRHMVFAHLELVEESLETPQEELEREERAARGEQEPDRETRYGFRTITTPTPAELWLTVEDLIPRIGNCIADVAYVWQKADVEYPRTQRLAQEGAKAFWEPLKNS